MQFVQFLPEKTALFQVVQQHLLTFEQQWTDKSDGRTLPSFVTDELHEPHPSAFGCHRAKWDE